MYPLVQGTRTNCRVLQLVDGDLIWLTERQTQPLHEHQTTKGSPVASPLINGFGVKQAENHETTTCVPGIIVTLVKQRSGVMAGWTHQTWFVRSHIHLILLGEEARRSDTRTANKNPTTLSKRRKFLWTLELEFYMWLDRWYDTYPPTK